jgi:hypothetical protein
MSRLIARVSLVVASLMLVLAAPASAAQIKPRELVLQETDLPAR